MTIKSSQLVALISGTAVLLVLGSLYTFGAIIPYISSYLYYQGHDVSSLQLSIVFTLAIIMINFGMPLGSIMSKYWSSRIICLVSVTCLSIVVFITSFLTSFIPFVIFYGIMNGLSIGFGYISPIKNAYTHFPNRKGFCAGICMSGFGFGSVIFNYVIIELINPDNVKVDHDTHRFPEDIANNLPFTLRILALIYFVVGIIGALFLSPERRKQIISLVTQDEQEDTKIQNPVSIPSLIYKKRAIWLILTLSCVVPFGMFIAFNYKELAFERNKQFQKEDHLITLIGSLGSFANGFSRAAWGTLFDRFSFKSIMTVITLVLLISSVVILWAVENQWTFMIIIPIIYFCYGGTFGIFPTQSIRVFGEKIGSNIYWIIFSGFSISAIIQFVIHYFVISGLGSDKGYVYCMSIFVGLQIIGLIIIQVIKYDYTNEKVVVP